MPFALGYDPSYAFDTAASHPERFGVIRLVDPADNEIAHTIGTLRENPGAVGIRVLLYTDEQLEQLAAGIYEPAFIAAERQEITTMVFGNLARIAEIARTHPALQLVVDHLGLARPRQSQALEDTFAGIPELLKLAQLENVAVKCSGVPALSNQRYPFSDVWPYLNQVLEAFGPERVMWGSDITACRNHTYCEGVSYMMHTDQLSLSEKALVLGQSLRNIFSWRRIAP